MPAKTYAESRFPQNILEQLIRFEKAFAAMEQISGKAKEKLDAITLEFNEKINAALNLPAETKTAPIRNLNDSVEYLEWILPIAKKDPESAKTRFLMFAGMFTEETKISIQDIDDCFPDELSKIIMAIRQLVNDSEIRKSKFQISRYLNSKSISIRRNLETFLNMLDKPSQAQSRKIMEMACQGEESAEILKIFEETNERLAELLIGIADEKPTPRQEIIIQTEPGALNESREWERFTTMITSLEIHKDIMGFIGTKRAGKNIATKERLIEFLKYRRKYGRRYSDVQLENIVNNFFKKTCAQNWSGEFKITMNNNNISAEINREMSIIDMKTQNGFPARMANLPERKDQLLEPLTADPAYEEWINSVAQKYPKNEEAYRHILTYIGKFPPETVIFIEKIKNNLRRMSDKIKQTSDIALGFYIFGLLKKLKEDSGTFTVMDEKGDMGERTYLIYKTGQTPKKEHKPLSKTTQSFLKWRAEKSARQIEPDENEYDDPEPLDFDSDVEDEDENEL
ncbi:MAG: hypothetical protein ABH856_00335 [Patescibacteria group bacterium]